MELHWYKTAKPVIPYILRDTATMFTGYEEKQDLPEREYHGFGTHEECYRVKPNKSVKAKKGW